MSLHVYMCWEYPMGVAQDLWEYKHTKAFYLYWYALLTQLGDLPLAFLVCFVVCLLKIKESI